MSHARLLILGVVVFFSPDIVPAKGVIVLSVQSLGV
jgi:hypothetical protein